MGKQYLGHLSPDDPLREYLSDCILPQVGVNEKPSDFRVFRLKSTKVYLYEESRSRAVVVGKFFNQLNAGAENAAAAGRMQQEFENLKLLRGYGLSASPCQIVRPLGANAWINCVLIEEFCPGTPLTSIINRAISSGSGGELYSKLTALAHFLATLHNRTANGEGVNFSLDCDYLNKLVHKLRSKDFLSAGEADEIYWLRDRWRDRDQMWRDRQVYVHGDATPSNFLFGSGPNVVAIDLERMRRADRVFDVGRIAGELQHFFIQATGNKYAAEPFIGHFLWEYCGLFPDHEVTFRSVTSRLPFQMALTLLRISRNSWISPTHRRRLIEEAKITLRTFRNEH